jgi:predicted permease
MKLIEILFPVFSIVLVGYLYGRLYQPVLRGINQMILLIFVPALVFDVMSSKEFQILEYGWLAIAGLIVVLFSGLVAWPIGKLMGYPLRPFLPPMMFNNCGNLGLPLAALAFGDAGLEAMVVLFLISNVLHFTLGTWIFGGIVSWKGFFLNPVNIATFLGLMVNIARIEIPGFLLQPISMLGQIVIPLMLFSLGIRMVSVQGAHLRSGLLGAFVCPLSSLIPALLVGFVLPLNTLQMSLLLLFSVLPPAVLNFLFAEQYDQNPELVASFVLVGNATAIVVVTGVLWWII